MSFDLLLLVPLASALEDFLLQSRRQLIEVLGLLLLLLLFFSFLFSFLNSIPNWKRKRETEEEG